MSRKRRNFGTSYKAKVALAAVRGEKTTAELASESGAHANQRSSRKRQRLDGMAELIGDGRRRRQSESSANERELFKQIGRLKMDVKWLKKNLPSSVEEKRRWVDRRYAGGEDQQAIRPNPSAPRRRRHSLLTPFLFATQRSTSGRRHARPSRDRSSSAADGPHVPAA